MVPSSDDGVTESGDTMMLVGSTLTAVLQPGGAGGIVRAGDRLRVYDSVIVALPEFLHPLMLCTQLHIPITNS